MLIFLFFLVSTLVAPSTPEAWKWAQDPSISLVTIIQENCKLAQQDPILYYDLLLEIAERKFGTSRILQVVAEAVVGTGFQVHDQSPRLRNVASAFGIDLDQKGWMEAVRRNEPASELIRTILAQVCAFLEAQMDEFRFVTSQNRSVWRSYIQVIDVDMLRKSGLFFREQGLEPEVIDELARRRVAIQHQYGSPELVVAHLNRLLLALSVLREFISSEKRIIKQKSEIEIPALLREGRITFTQMSTETAFLLVREEKVKKREHRERAVYQEIKTILWSNPNVDIAMVTEDFNLELPLRVRIFRPPIEQTLSPLNLAIGRDLPDMAVELLQNGADVNYASSAIIGKEGDFFYAFDHVSPLALAILLYAWRKRLLFTRILQRGGILWKTPDVNAMPIRFGPMVPEPGTRFLNLHPSHMIVLHSGLSPLLLALYFHSARTPGGDVRFDMDIAIAQLLDYGADVNMVSVRGLSALSIAASHNDGARMRDLLARGAHVNVSEASNRLQPLFVLASRNRIDFDLLWDFVHEPKVDLTIDVPNQGNLINMLLTFRYRTGKNNTYRIVAYLIQQGVSVEETTAMQSTALMLALDAQASDIVELVLVNVSDDNLRIIQHTTGQTALESGLETVVETMQEGSGLDPVFVALLKQIAQRMGLDYELELSRVEQAMESAIFDASHARGRRKKETRSPSESEIWID